MPETIFPNLLFFPPLDSPKTSAPATANGLFHTLEDPYC